MEYSTENRHHCTSLPRNITSDTLHEIEQYSSEIKHNAIDNQDDDAPNTTLVSTSSCSDICKHFFDPSKLNSPDNFKKKSFARLANY